MPRLHAKAPPGFTHYNLSRSILQRLLYRHSTRRKWRTHRKPPQNASLEIPRPVRCASPASLLDLLLHPAVPHRRCRASLSFSNPAEPLLSDIPILSYNMCRRNPVSSEKNPGSRIVCDYILWGMRILLTGETAPGKTMSLRGAQRRSNLNPGRGRLLRYARNDIASAQPPQNLVAHHASACGPPMAAQTPPAARARYGPMWTSWTKWTPWTARGAECVHPVHAVHSVHNVQRRSR